MTRSLPLHCRECGVRWSPIVLRLHHRYRCSRYGPRRETGPARALIVDLVARVWPSREVYLAPHRLTWGEGQRVEVPS